MNGGRDSGDALLVEKGTKGRDISDRAPAEEAVDSRDIGVELQSGRMPWLTTKPMDERVKFICAYLPGELSVSRLCATFGVSRKTAYKWIVATPPAESPSSWNIAASPHKPSGNEPRGGLAGRGHAEAPVLASKKTSGFSSRLLLGRGRCVTSSYAMATLTVRLSEQMRRELNRLARERGRPAGEIVRDSLSRYLAVERFRALRGRALPFAEAQGFLTDEDIFKAVS